MNIFKNYFINSIERLTINFLSRNNYGEIYVTFPSGISRNFIGNLKGHKADIKFNNYKLIYKLFKNGSVGFAESYMDGDFETQNLSNLLLFAHQNELSYLNKKKANFVNNFSIQLHHYLNKNTKKGSKKNIYHHYDLGINFYEYWFDESMTYCSALF